MARCVTLFCLFVPLFFPLFSGAAEVQEKHWVATIPPIKALLLELTKGTQDKVELLLPAGQDPHHFALRPSQAEMLEEADQVFYVSDLFEAFLRDRIQRNSARFYGVYTALPPGDEMAKAHGWLSLKLTAAALPLLAEKLAEINPENKDIYINNSNKYKQKINSQIKLTQTQFKRLKSRILFEDADALNAVALDWSLQHSNINKGLHEVLKHEGVKCVFVTHGHSKLAEKLAEAQGWKLTLLPTMEKDAENTKGADVVPYLDGMKTLLQRIRACLT